MIAVADETGHQEERRFEAMSDEQLLGALGRAREDVRNEREERRGLENRASALLVAGVFVIGLVAQGLSGVNVGGTTRDWLTAGLAVSSAVMVVAIGLLVRALTPKPTPPLHDDARTAPSLDKQLEAERNAATTISTNNRRTLDCWLRPATITFGASIAGFLIVVVLAAFASSPPPQPPSPASALQSAKKGR